MTRVEAVLCGAFLLMTAMAFVLAVLLRREVLENVRLRVAIEKARLCRVVRGKEGAKAIMAACLAIVEAEGGGQGEN